MGIFITPKLLFKEHHRGIVVLSTSDQTNLHFAWWSHSGPTYLIIYLFFIIWVYSSGLLSRNLHRQALHARLVFCVVVLGVGPEWEHSQSLYLLLLIKQGRGSTCICVLTFYDFALFISINIILIHYNGLNNFNKGQ